MLRIGIDLGGTKTEIIALDGGGKELVRKRTSTPAQDYPAILATLTALVRDVENQFGRADSIGIGTPGAMSPATGRMKNSNTTCLNDRPLHADLERVLGRGVTLANDADCFVLSEAVDGSAREADVVFGVILGTGVGGGIAVHRKVLRGPNAVAGEWGHNPLPWMCGTEVGGAACYCGKSGCIETFLSGPGLSADHLAVSGRHLSADVIAREADSGDEACRRSLLRYQDRLARALSLVINILDPHMIVLGGGLSNCGQLYENVPRLWQQYVFSDQVGTVLASPLHGDSSGVRGAAWLGGGMTV